MPADNSEIPPANSATSYAATWISRRTTRWLTPILLLLGVQCWLVLGEGNYGYQNKPLMILAAIVAGLIPPINRAFNWLWNAVSQPSPKKRRFIALAIWLASSLFLYCTERYQQIPFKPKFEDEFSYLIQMRMLAHGRFWMSAIPLPEFFNTFYLLVTPVYASMYFPGAAMMYAPALILHLPYWIGPLIASGLCAAMLYLILCDILDGASAILGVLLLLSLKMFRMMSIMPMAQIPTLLLGLIMTWAVLRWRVKKKTGYLLLFGAAAGWAAITRPADALCFAIVLAVVMAMDLKNSPWPTWAKTAAWAIAPALPFLILQLILNRNITGQWLTTPFARYNEINYPGTFGFHSGPAPLHVSNVPEAQVFYELMVRGVVEQHQLKNLISIGLKSEWEMTRRVAIADPFLWLIMPLSLLAMWNRRLWAVWGMLPIFLLLLSAYAFSWVLPHYYIMAMPAMILLSILPIRFLTDSFPNRAAMIRTMIALPIIAFSLAAMPQFNRITHDTYFEPPELATIDNDLAAGVSAPAVVMFHYNRDALIDGKRITNNPSEEPVFNRDVAWPDDAPIIRAHDINPDISAIANPGDRDRPLYEYYSRVDPARVFYLYNRGGSPPRLHRLGTADQLLRATSDAP